MGQDYHAARKGDLKLLRNDPYSPLELYDLGTDEMESEDLMNQERSELTELRRFMQGQIQKAGGIPWQRSTAR